jgi:hypothetical protein
MERKKAAVFLTTLDNPFDPSVQWDEWRTFDEGKGYFSNAYLARMAKVSNELSEKDYLVEVERAIDRICELNVLGIYKKIVVYE